MHPHIWVFLFRRTNKDKKVALFFDFPCNPRSQALSWQNEQSGGKKMTGDNQDESLGREDSHEPIEASDWPNVDITEGVLDEFIAKTSTNISAIQKELKLSRRDTDNIRGKKLGAQVKMEPLIQLDQYFEERGEPFFLNRCLKDPSQLPLETVGDVHSRLPQDSRVLYMDDLCRVNYPELKNTIDKKLIGHTQTVYDLVAADVQIDYLELAESLFGYSSACLKGDEYKMALTISATAKASVKIPNCRDELEVLRQTLDGINAGLGTVHLDGSTNWLEFYDRGNAAKDLEIALTKLRRDHNLSVRILEYDIDTVYRLSGTLEQRQQLREADWGDSSIERDHWLLRGAYTFSTCPQPAVAIIMSDQYEKLINWRFHTQRRLELKIEADFLFSP